jgi:SET domain
MLLPSNSFVCYIVKPSIRYPAYTITMGRFKKPVPKTVKCEDCGRLFGKERDLTQHLNSKAHTPVINHDIGTLPNVHYQPVTSATPSFQSPVPRPMGLDDKPAEVEFPKKESATPKLYILTPVPGKGQGLIAVQDISKGTRILSDKPLFRIQSFGSELPVIEKEIERKLNLLSQDDQKDFFSLHNSTPGDPYPLTGIVKTNALSLGSGFSGSSVGGIFSTISRINHSCRPNTQHTWNASTGHETIHAIRDIKKGEEITISYNLGGPSQPRMQRLKRSYGFDCTCDLCSLTGEALETSDARQLRIQFLDDAIGDSNAVMERPGTALARCRELLSLYEIEAITDPRVARVYYDAFQICITHGDEARASLFARKAYETRLYLEGEDSPDTQKMKSFMANPANHMAFGYSESWEQSKAAVPKNVNAQEFDRWLWLQANSTDDNSDTSSSFDSLDSASIWRKLRSSFR